jgi:hypothetical protein
MKDTSKSPLSAATFRQLVLSAFFLAARSFALALILLTLFWEPLLLKWLCLNLSTVPARKLMN